MRVSLGPAQSPRQPLTESEPEPVPRRLIEFISSAHCAFTVSVLPLPLPSEAENKPDQNRTELKTQARA